MATDIHGWVEIYNTGSWDGVIYIEWLVEQNYKLFGSFFGVQSSGEPAPFAARRGLPEDVSEEAQHDFGVWKSAAHSPSWIGYHEIGQIDWTQRVIDYWKLNAYHMENGTIMFYDRTLFNLPQDDRIENPEAFYIDENDPLLEPLKTTLQIILDNTPGWKLLFAMMKQLAERYGNEGVRLVVWFDN